MSRVTWFVAGAATGVYGLVRGRRAARNLTPDGLAARAAAIGAGLRVLTSELSTGMAERETQLRDKLSLPPQHALGAVSPTAIEPATSQQNGTRNGHR